MIDVVVILPSPNAAQSHRMKAPQQIRLHGIANCDTVKRARAWLGGRAVDHAWVDFRKQPPSIEQIRRWAGRVGWEALLNRRGTTWRSPDDAQRAAVRDEASAIALMHERPTLIRRPVVEAGEHVVVGFAAPDSLRRLAAK